MCSSHDLFELCNQVHPTILTWRGRCCRFGTTARAPTSLGFVNDNSGADIDMGTLRSHTRIISESVGATGSGAGAHCISRSYRHPFALIATHTDVLGVDIERVDPFDKDFAESICTPSEWSSDATRPRGAVELADVWSTKEALAKALGNALDYDPRRLVSLALAPNSRASTWQAARVSVPSGYVGWVIWRRSDAEQ